MEGNLVADVIAIFGGAGGVAVAAKWAWARYSEQLHARILDLEASRDYERARKERAEEIAENGNRIIGEVVGAVEALTSTIEHDRADMSAKLDNALTQVLIEINRAKTMLDQGEVDNAD